MRTTAGRSSIAALPSVWSQEVARPRVSGSLTTRSHRPYCPRTPRARRGCNGRGRLAVQRDHAAEGHDPVPPPTESAGPSLELAGPVATTHWCVPCSGHPRRRALRRAPAARRPVRDVRRRRERRQPRAHRRKRKHRLDGDESRGAAAAARQGCEGIEPLGPIPSCPAGKGIALACPRPARWRPRKAVKPSGARVKSRCRTGVRLSGANYRSSVAGQLRTGAPPGALSVSGSADATDDNLLLAVASSWGVSSDRLGLTMQRKPM